MIVKLTKEEIAILKAGLEYFSFDDEFGYQLWQTIPGSNVSLNDFYYRLKAAKIYRKLDEVTKVKPKFSWWGSIERLFTLCDRELKRAKWYEGREWRQTELQGKSRRKIRCFECDKEYEIRELKFDWDRPRKLGWYYFKCSDGHLINESPVTLLKTEED